MKRVSVLSFMDALCDTTSLECYKIVAGDNGEGRSEGSSSENAKAPIESGKVKLTGAGSAIVDVFKTIDCLNALDLKYHKMILNEFYIEDYQVLDCFKPLIRPDRVLACEETNGVRQLDMLEPYSDLVDPDLGGKVLSPAQFVAAQNRLLRIINHKSAGGVNYSTFSRELVVITQAIIEEYPVRIDGELRALMKSTVVRPFTLKERYYEDEEYTNVYTKSNVVDAFVKMAGQLVIEAGLRVQTSN